MRATILMISAGLSLGASMLHATDISLTAEQQEMQQLLQQMPGIPESERLLMQEAIMQPIISSVEAERAEMLGLLREMTDLPEKERRLMEQAILKHDFQPLEEVAQQGCMIVAQRDESDCGSA